MKAITTVFLISLLYGCGEKHDKISAVLKNEPLSASILPDSFANVSEVSFLAVYKLTPTIMAVVIPLSSKEEGAPTFFDSVVNGLKYSEKGSLMPIGSHLFDTTGEYRLLKNQKLADNIKKHIAPYYYIYGMKGTSKVAIQDIIFALDECKTSFIALTLRNLDTAKYGIPLLCSNKQVNLIYGKNYSDREKEIEKLYQSQKGDYDYLDSIQTKVFAQDGSFYFTYNDDFLWDRVKGKQKCFFPMRAIFTRSKDGSLKQYWTECIDLFGVPCD